MNTTISNIIEGGAKTEFENYVGSIAEALLGLLLVGITFRIVVIIQQGRSNEASWTQIFNQAKVEILIGAIAIVAESLIVVISSYY